MPSHTKDIYLYIIKRNIQAEEYMQSYKIQNNVTSKNMIMTNIIISAHIQECRFKKKNSLSLIKNCGK